jgi:hypothetical protein
MSKILAAVLSVGLGLLPCVARAAGPADEQIARDSKGRVISRIKANADGGTRRTAIQYASESERPAVVVDEDADPQGRPTKRVEQRFDGQGRLREKLEVAIDPDGREHGTRTRYRYEPSGKRLEDVQRVN